MNLEDFKLKYQKQPVIEYANSVKESPLVSVCVGTYQHASYIKDCLEGILMQKTTFSFEILLGEDASTDGAREICIEYAKKYPDKIKLFLHHRENNIKINGAFSGRFNFIYNLFNSKGKYIALCDGDDYWIDPFKLQEQVNFLEQNTSNILCGTEVSVFQKNGNIKEKTQKSTTIKLVHLEDVLKNYPFYTCTIVFKNGPIPMELFQDFNAGDHALISYLLQFGNGVILPKVTTVYNFHGNGISSSLNHERYLYHRLNDRKALIKLHKPYFKWIIKKQGLVIIWNYLKQAIRWRKEFINALYSNRKLIIKYILN
ncbi:glycosyltransferase family 2 protein [Lutibacter flavus]|uniref:Glycosyltransferase involved in cell wall bisynthesis n=1 Tax=Lutibacter flavus TaxID=691689 RepID=A0A238YZ10_9FLAO|nr:glycosyltransferase [Lutibacter flavus]SNR75981.1 Glycosyltransferase involved in cell wall bisynthesis [Lutibacter flavus]